ncbi:MAG: hypothetical protein WDO15_20745 [Bacteroidota bacterium]
MRTWDSVFLSYQYQIKGLGEIPDDGDRLLVSFLDKDSRWIPVDTINNDGTIETNLFYTSFVQISDPKYYHSGFQFMFQNFGRKSGPYDAWHLDYIISIKKEGLATIHFPTVRYRLRQPVYSANTGSCQSIISLQTMA